MFWEITCRSLLYLKREQEGLNLEMHHLLMSSLFRQHFNPDRL
jgi:hypothetical protein